MYVLLVRFIFWFLFEIFFFVECLFGYFGVGCMGNCSGNCINNIWCDYIIGECLDGCMDGYIGKRCENCKWNVICYIYLKVCFI